MSNATPNERYFAKLVNDARAEEGLSALKLERSLNTAAEKHSQWMLDADVFSHTGENGSSPTDRIKASGFDLSGSWSTAENIAYVGADTSDGLQDEINQLHSNLMNSPGHYANIMSDKSSVLGIGLELGTFESNGREFQVLMATQNYADTDGKVDLDTGGTSPEPEPGTPTPDPESDTLSTASAPSFTPAETRAEWLQDFTGRVIGSEGDGELTLGTSQADDVRFGSTNDRIRAGAGDDWIATGGGDDRVATGTGNDRANGGSGKDLIWGSQGNDTLLGEGGDDRIKGGEGNDRLYGNSGNDILDGGANNDWLLGGAGTDILRGGEGADTLVGGDGNDRMRGGTGADTFLFRQGSDTDTIFGFEAGDDRILIEKKLVGSDDVDAFLRDHVSDTEGGVTIELNGGDKIVLAGASLNADDVIDDIFLI